MVTGDRPVFELRRRHDAACRLLIDALTVQTIDPGLAVWGAWVLLERARGFLDLLEADRAEERCA